MRIDAIRELFDPTGLVEIRRMFGGQGIYRQGRMIAITADGGLWLKTDAESRPAFADAGAKPFSFARSDGSVTVLSYWSLPEEAFDDPDSMARWVRLAEAAAARTAAARPPKRPREKR